MFYFSLYKKTVHAALQDSVLWGKPSLCCRQHAFNIILHTFVGVSSIHVIYILIRQDNFLNGQIVALFPQARKSIFGGIEILVPLELA